MKWFLSLFSRVWNRRRIRAVLKMARVIEARLDRPEEACRPDPSRIPDNAKSCLWEATHLFPAGTVVERSPQALYTSSPALALVCPECDLRQYPLYSGRARRCGYCGAHLHAHGARVYAWHTVDQAVPADWSPKPSGSNAR